MEAAQARLSLHLSEYHIVGNHMSRLICECKITYNGNERYLYRKCELADLLQSGETLVGFVPLKMVELKKCGFYLLKNMMSVSRNMYQRVNQERAVGQNLYR